MTNFGKWFLSGSAAIIGGIVGFILSQSLAFYTFSQNLAVTKNIEMIHLARELTKEFYSGDKETEVYRQVRMAIEQCEPLYKGYSANGHFNNDEINRYLGFFEDLGFYYSEGALDLRFIAQDFGAYIIEAYEYNELRKYMKELQENSKQKDAFIHFQGLARDLEKRSEWQELVALSRQACTKSK